MWVQLWVGLLLSAFAADRQAELIDPRKGNCKGISVCESDHTLDCKVCAYYLSMHERGTEWSESEEELRIKTSPNSKPTMKKKTIAKKESE